MNYNDEISRMPFLRILPLVVLGIVTANAVDIPIWVSATLAVLLLTTALVFLKKSYSSVLTALTVFFTACLTTTLTATQQIIPHDEKLVMAITITDTPEQSGQWTKASARIDSYRHYNADTSAWHKSDEKMIARFDSSLSPEAGDRMIVTGRVGNLGTKDYASYVSLMKRRGYSATLWVNQYDKVVMLPEKHRDLRYLGLRMQAAADERLSRLRLTQSAMNTAEAMSLGIRSGMDKQTRDEYSATGASHLLSVSGFHVGIVAMLVNILLWLLPSVRSGHIIKNATAIIVIWLYALMTGLSPSVVRSAAMFSGAQLAFASSRGYAGGNILLATASVMLLLAPNYLYDISFQLSFAAVAGIFTLYKPLYNSVKSRFKVTNAFWSVFMVGLAATLVTIPLVSYYFGRIPVIGILINPFLILTANITVLLSIFWILMPIPLLNGIFSTAINFAANLQNDMIAVSAAKSWASLPLRVEMWQALLIYAAAIAAGIIIYTKRRDEAQKKQKTKLPV